MENKELNKIYEVLDHQARSLVGILLKRLEVLSVNKAFSIELYKALIKEIIYEQFRNLRDILEVHLTIGKVEFKTKPKE